MGLIISTNPFLSSAAECTFASETPDPVQICFGVHVVQKPTISMLSIFVGPLHNIGTRSIVTPSVPGFGSWSMLTSGGRFALEMTASASLRVYPCQPDYGGCTAQNHEAVSAEAEYVDTEVGTESRAPALVTALTQKCLLRAYGL